MTSQSDIFSERIVASQSRASENSMQGKGLRIAVLGPNLDNLQDTGTLKRYQISDALKDDGHEPFFPESYIEASDPNQVWLRVERQMLSDESVDLVIILHTDSSFGVLSEISNFLDVPDIHGKSAILFPAQFYMPNENLPANTVQAYYSRKIYTDDEMRACHLVEECRKWAYARRIGNWPGMEFQEF